MGDLTDLPPRAKVSIWRDHLGTAAMGASGFHRMDHAAGIFGKFFAPENLHADDDGHERVVQIMGDTADEDTEAFEPLGAQELFLQQFVAGDVGIDDDEQDLEALASSRTTV